MIQSLYKVKPPANIAESEVFELILERNPDEDGSFRYYVREMHGWWDEEHRRLIHQRSTFNGEEGFPTWDAALERFNTQKLQRAREGFRHVLWPDYYGEKPYEYEYISDDALLP